MVTDVNPQPPKALFPIDVTLFPIVTDINPLQPRKASSPIDVISSPKTTSFIEVWLLNHELPTDLHNKITDNSLQSLNTSLPIDVTLLGMVIEIKLLQPLNAKSLIWLTERGRSILLRFDLSLKK